MPRILSLSCRITLRMCVPFFQRPLSSCAGPRVYRFLFAKPPQYYSSCSVVCGSSRPFSVNLLIIATGMFWGLLPARYRVAFPSRSCNRTPKLLPCFMMGSVCPVHVLYGPAPVKFDPFVKPHQPCMYCCDDFCFWLLQRYVPATMYQVVCTRYQVSDRALFPRARLVCCFPCVYVPILKEHENLHVHFEDCVGRRVTNVSGAFLELAPSSGSSSDAFHINNLFFSCTPSLRLE